MVYASLNSYRLVFVRLSNFYFVILLELLSNIMKAYIEFIQCTILHIVYLITLGILSYCFSAFPRILFGVHNIIYCSIDYNSSHENILYCRSEAAFDFESVRGCPKIIIWSQEIVITNSSRKYLLVWTTQPCRTPCNLNYLL